MIERDYDSVIRLSISLKILLFRLFIYHSFVFLQAESESCEKIFNFLIYLALL